MVHACYMHAKMLENIICSTSYNSLWSKYHTFSIFDTFEGSYTSPHFLFPPVWQYT